MFLKTFETETDSAVTESWFTSDQHCLVLQFDLSFVNLICCAGQNGRLTTNQGRNVTYTVTASNAMVWNGDSPLRLAKMEIGLNGRQTRSILVCKWKVKVGGQSQAITMVADKCKCAANICIRRKAMQLQKWRQFKNTWKVKKKCNNRNVQQMKKTSCRKGKQIH